MRQTVDEPKRSKTPFVLGCCGGGCLAVVLGTIGIFIYVASFVKNLPEPNPSVQMKPYVQDDFDTLAKRYNTYQEKVDAGNAAAEEFVVTEEELNMALSRWHEDDPDGPLVNVKLDGQVATGSLSLPWPQDDGTKKWVNGEAVFTVAITSGMLDIRIKELKVKGKNIPQAFMESFSKENLAKDLNKDPNYKKMLKDIDKVEIKDSKVHIKLKSTGTAEPGAAPETDEVPKALPAP